MGDTSYNVSVKYVVDSKSARAGLAGINEDVKKVTESNKEAKTSFGVLGVAIAAGMAVGLHEARKHLIDFNRDVENAKIGLSAMIQGNLGGSWDMAKDKANALYTEFQKFSTQTPVTTQEILNFGKGVAVATFQAGGSVKDMTKITEQGVIAAKAFGYESNYTALEISEALSGNVTNRMMFVKSMLGVAHVSMEEFRKLNAEQRLDLVRNTLNSAAFQNAAKEFADSWSGVTSTLEDKLQIALGRVGLPLFEAIKNEIKGWSEWLDENKTKVDEIGHSIGQGLVKGFTIVKDAVSLLVSNASLLMSVGKVWLALQVGGLIKGGVGAASVLGSGAGGLKGFFTKAGDKLGGDPFDPEGQKYVYTSAGRGQQNVTIGNIAGNLPLIAQAAAVGVAIGSLVNEFTGIQQELHDLGLDKTTREFEKVQRASDTLAEAMARASDSMPGSAKAVTNLAGAYDMQKTIANLARDAIRGSTTESTEAGDVITRYDASKLKQLYAMGIDQADISKAGGLEKFADAAEARANQLGAQKGGTALFGYAGIELGIAQLTDYQRQTLDEAKATQDVLTYINNTLSKNGALSMDTIMNILRHDTEDPNGTHKPMAAKPNVTVHINRIEVQSDDPDRIAFGLVESFKDAAKNPSSAFAALREG